MLVLSRKEDESIMIDVQGTPIYVHILSIGGASNNIQVSIGVDAPRAWNIRRTELPEFLRSKPVSDISVESIS